MQLGRQITIRIIYYKIEITIEGPESLALGRTMAQKKTKANARQRIKLYIIEIL